MIVFWVFVLVSSVFCTTAINPIDSLYCDFVEKEEGSCKVYKSCDEVLPVFCPVLYMNYDTYCSEMTCPDALIDYYKNLAASTNQVCLLFNLMLLTDIFT